MVSQLERQGLLVRRTVGTSASFAELQHCWLPSNWLSFEDQKLLHSTLVGSPGQMAFAPLAANNLARPSAGTLTTTITPSATTTSGCSARGYLSTPWGSNTVAYRIVALQPKACSCQGEQHVR